MMNKLLEKLISRIINGFSASDLERLEAEVRQSLFRKKAAARRLVSFSNQREPFFSRSFRDGCLPPRRFSDGDLTIYRQVFSGLDKRSRVLILGAAPELRDLAASKEIKAVVVDLSLEGIVEALQYAGKVNIDNEIWVKSDWLNMPIGGDFDVVLGDTVLDTVKQDCREELLGKIRKVLAPNGIFVARVGSLREGAHGQARTDDLFGKFFDIVAVRTAGDHPDSEFCPVYILKPRPLSHS